MPPSIADFSPFVKVLLDKCEGFPELREKIVTNIFLVINVYALGSLECDEVGLAMQYFAPHIFRKHHCRRIGNLALRHESQ